ncbi:uncharacterized protein TNCV_1361601 [Trichonephila clavipes]|nr:uncharacterized protein TNCV_1361601 [Trichonephila clavipes]
MFDSSKPDDDVMNFVSKLKSHMQSLHPKPPKHLGKRPVFIHPGLLEATHVFLRRDMLRRPLQQPYDGPFKVLQRKDKVFFLDINGKRNETPATVEPNATPATVEHDPTASTPTQPSTRSGRKVHLPTRVSSGLLGKTLWEGRGHYTKIQICLATHGRKRLHSTLGGIVHKSIGANRPASPQSFELPSPTEEYGMFYKHQAGRYKPDLRNGRRKCTSSRKIVSRKDCVYVPPLPAVLPDLRHRIEAAVAKITSDTLNKVWNELAY